MYLTVCVWATLLNGLALVTYMTMRTWAILSTSLTLKLHTVRVPVTKKYQHINRPEREILMKQTMWQVVYMLIMIPLTCSKEPRSVETNHFTDTCCSASTVLWKQMIKQKQTLTVLNIDSLSTAWWVSLFFSFPHYKRLDLRHPGHSHTHLATYTNQ